jgi:hypothetical protein
VPRLVTSSRQAPGYEIPQAFVDEARGMNLRVFAATSQAGRAYLEQRALPERLAALRKPLLAFTANHAA